MSSAVLITSPTVKQSNVFTDIIDGYAKLASSPLALTLFIFALLAIVAESNQQNGPFEIFKTTLDKYIKDEKHPAFLRTIATIVDGIVNIIIKWKKYVFLVMMIVTIPLAYPERDTAFSVVFLFLYVGFSSHSQFILFCIIQLTYIYYSLSDFVWKVIDFIIIVIIALGTESFSLMFVAK